MSIRGGTLLFVLLLLTGAAARGGGVHDSVDRFLRSLVPGEADRLVAEEAARGRERVARKAALSHVVLQSVYADELLRAAWLSDAEKWRVIARAEAERLALSDLYRETERIVKSPSLTVEEKTEAVAAAGYNRRVNLVLAQSAGLIDAGLGRNAARFFAWLNVCWRDAARTAERYASTNGWRSGRRLTYTVFATQYFGETSYEAALPDQYVKFANRDWAHYPGYEGDDYSVKLERSGWTVSSVIVWDVGPWNIDDNYWNPATGHPRPRRLFTDLPQGTPEAQAAYYNGYNNGLDQFGRTVTVPTALDMTPDLAADLGLGYLQNDWITVTYLWEQGGGVEVVIDDSDPECTFHGPSQYWWEVSGYGMNNQMHYTYNIVSGWTNAATWVFDAPSAGTYEIAVFIPRNHATATSARYYLNRGTIWYGPRSINQNTYYDEWVVLGNCWLRQGSNWVAVIDGTGEPAGSTKVGVDAARIRKID